MINKWIVGNIFLDASAVFNVLLVGYDFQFKENQFYLF